MNFLNGPDRSDGYHEYVDRIGELVIGHVTHFDGADIIVDLGRIEAILPRSQQSRHERWKQGERIRAVITNVDLRAKLKVELSRASPNLLRRLFEIEVPEIYDGTILIKSAVREAGERAKIAVMSNDPNVDPVRACAGVNGSRVLPIMAELRGEKIDIVAWSAEPLVFAANALGPAQIKQVRITDSEQRLMEAIVDADQLSLIVGRRGVNVRLAANLVGWDIDVRSEEGLPSDA